MKTKNLLCLLMALLLTLPLASCGSTSPETTPEGDSQAADEIAEETEPDILAGISYGGADFHIMTSDTAISSNYLLEGSGELTGDIVNDAVFERNLAAEEQLDIHLTYTHTDRNWGDVYSGVTQIVLSGDDTFDMIVDDQLGMSSASIDKVFVDVAALPTVDLEAGYWSGDYMYNLSIDYKSVYLMVGDYFMDVLNHSHALLYNRDMYNNLYGDPDALYQMVQEGKWTYDQWIALSEGAYQDINGDGKLDADDVFGMIVGGIGGSSFPFTYGSDVPFVSRDASGYPTLTMYCDRLLTLYDKIYAMFYGAGTYTKYTENGEDLHQKFMAEGALFISGAQLGDFGVFRDMEAEVGIIPYPKLDEAQVNYVTVVHDTAEVGAIPITARDHEMSGAVAHLLCRLTHETVLPAHYEMSLKIKYARDNYTSAMIDLIHDGIMDMFCLVYGGAHANNIFTWTILEPLQKGTDAVTSAYQTRESGAIQGLSDLVETFKNNQPQ
ncbi:MAG: hypothetical protein IKY52_00055 [Clostridia bacterium]|nr:hypothetical protein [Clostridia bacterium]